MVDDGGQTQVQHCTRQSSPALVALYFVCWMPRKAHISPPRIKCVEDWEEEEPVNKQVEQQIENNHVTNEQTAGLSIFMVLRWLNYMSCLFVSPTGNKIASSTAQVRLWSATQNCTPPRLQSSCHWWCRPIAQLAIPRFTGPWSMNEWHGTRVIIILWEEE